MNNNPSGAVLFCWSGGKDGAMALHRLIEGGTRVAGLLTTLTEDYGRVCHHGVREVLLDRQAEALGLPVEKIWLRAGGTNEDYEEAMRAALGRAKADGVEAVAFGDLFLEDLRRHREAKLAAAGMKALFPIWGEDTARLAREFPASGFRAVIACVDGHSLPGELAGMEYGPAFIAALPAGTDPCGENGEFHTFVYDAPVFRRPVAWRRGAVVERERRFFFQDLLPPEEEDS